MRLRARVAALGALLGAFACGGPHSAPVNGPAGPAASAEVRLQWTDIPPSTAGAQHHDAIPDAVDACPDLPGVDNASAGENGGPRKQLILQTESDLLLIEWVRFGEGSSKMKRVSYPLLDEVVHVLRQHPEIGLEIIGHSDSREWPTKNLRLSEARARAVMRYLVSRGVDAKRLSTTGEGGTHPRYPSDTEVQRRENRHVEFKVLEGLPAGQVAKPGPLGVARIGVALDIERLRSSSPERALDRALDEYRRAPGAVSAVLVGESFEALGRTSEAAHAYGSLFDFADHDGSLLAAAGFWLEHLASHSTGPDALRAEELALSAFRKLGAGQSVDPGPTYEKAMALARTGHAMKAYELLRDGTLGLELPVPRPPFPGRFPKLQAVLELLAAAALRADPANASRIAHETSGSKEPSLVVILDTGTRGAADLFLARADRTPPAYATSVDQATPEAVSSSLTLWSVTGAAAKNRYRVAVQARTGPMPLFGRVTILRHHGHGNVDIENRPLLLQTSGVFVGLGEVDGTK